MEVINAACFLCANDTSDQKLMHIQMQQFRRFACTAQQVSFLVSFTIERHCKWHAGTVFEQRIQIKSYYNHKWEILTF